jgi:hypothetical protein
MLSTDQFKEIILTEDEDVLGIRFRQPNAITEPVFEGDLFVDKRGSLGEEFIRLINRIVN